MYTPAHFRNDNRSEILDFIRANSFGILISAESKIHATHIPLELSSDEKFLSGHLSRGNPQGKELRDGLEVLCIFNGPHSYISSSWYDHENVPTWNYIAVHVKGRIRMLEGDELYRRLVELVDKYEAGSARPVSVQNMSPDYVQKHINGIFAFDVAISAIEASYKLSQNRDKKNFKNIIDALEQRGDSQSLTIAAEMKKQKPAYE